ncbi:DMT family transporter [Bdellovibrio bacteriovorus]|uniref:EamA family transporter n=1 Tax=Bdellovibrio bacteriovorus TaxID=959 RepID=UPI0035A5A416
MFSIQFGASIAKHLFPQAGAAGTTALRVSMSAVLLLVAARVWKHKISRESIPSIAAYGVSLGLMNLLFYFALERIPLGLAVALEFVGPLSVALLSSKRALDIVWAVLAGLGIYFVLPIGETNTTLDMTGVALALIAGVFWGLYIIFGKKAAKNGGSLVITAWGMAFAALVSFPVGVFINGEQIKNPGLWPMGLLIAILSSALPYSLEMKAMRNMPAKTFGILMSLEPVVATFMGILLLQEHLTLTQWSAIACIIAASVGSTATAK